MISRIGERLGGFGRWQFLSVVGLAIAGYFVMSFGGLVLSGYQLNQQASSLRSDIQDLRAENERLENEIRSLLSEDAVEKLAREELGWAKPGETAIIVVPTKREGHIGGDVGTPFSGQEVPNWRRWWDMFFGVGSSLP